MTDRSCIPRPSSSSSRTGSRAERRRAGCPKTPAARGHPRGAVLAIIYVEAVALYTADSKERVRDAVDFVELVSAHTELRRAGPARYEGRWPFHDERTPSFGIDPQQKVYYCFGCNASGDVFTFVQEKEGVDFKGALELLAERVGVELEREAEDPKAQEQRLRRERLLELLERTTAYYERYL